MRRCELSSSPLLHVSRSYSDTAELQYVLFIEARVRGELASSAAIVPDREDKGEGVYILRFSMYLPHAIALRASLVPGTLVLDDPIFRLFQHNRVSPPGGVLPGALGAAESLPLTALPDLARMLTVNIPVNHRFCCQPTCLDGAM